MSTEQRNLQRLIAKITWTAGREQAVDQIELSAIHNAEFRADDHSGDQRKHFGKTLSW